jgi:hypothetical protein
VHAQDVRLHGSMLADLCNATHPNQGMESVSFDPSPYANDSQVVIASAHTEHSRTKEVMSLSTKFTTFPGRDGYLRVVRTSPAKPTGRLYVASFRPTSRTAFQCELRRLVDRCIPTSHAENVRTNASKASHELSFDILACTKWPRLAQLL